MNEPQPTIAYDGPPSPVPELLGDYELLAEVARGGMGIVYKARQISLNRIVALKVIITGESANSEAGRRFRIEAEAAAQLDHPHIVPVYDVGEHASRQYYTMRLIDGGSLDKILPELSRDPKRTAILLAKVARAVHFSHQRGVLHRDLKPGNILVDQQGEPHVADFGLAKRMRDGLASVTCAMGTPEYMAPEQALNQKGLTTAVDVYGLGAVLYECLTGKPPFAGDNVLELIQAVVLDEPTKPSNINALADSDLSVIALKCLSKEPTRRYASAEELAEDLERRVRGDFGETCGTD